LVHIKESLKNEKSQKHTNEIIVKLVLTLC
jgi:hypothetical protein